MNWSDYEMIWKRQKPPLGAGADVTELKDTFEAKRRKLYAALLVRDYSETAAGLLGGGAFALLWWKMGRVGWPIGIALLLILGVCSVFVRERLRVRRLRLGADAPLLAKVGADLTELQYQRQLILKLWWWYLGPILVAVAIIGCTISRSRPAWDIARDPVFITGHWILNTALFWFAWEINRRAVRKQIEPRIAELEKLRRDLLSAS